MNTQSKIARSNGGSNFNSPIKGFNPLIFEIKRLRSRGDGDFGKDLESKSPGDSEP